MNKAYLEGLCKSNSKTECYCPRCGRKVMNPEPVRNALSRIANVYICSNCGTEEAMCDLYGVGPDEQMMKWAVLKTGFGKGIEWDGKHYDITEKEAEEIYRYVEHKYRMEDAKNHLMDIASEYGDEEDYKENLKNEFDVEFDDAMEELDSMVDEFEDRMDCNVPENAVWDAAIRYVLNGMN